MKMFGHITDDRGSRVPLCPTGTLPASLSSAEARRAIARAHGDTWWYRVMIVLNVGLIVGGVVSMVRRAQRPPAPPTLQPPFDPTPWLSLALVACSIVLIVTTFSLRSRRTRTARAACLEHSLCPSCGYTLTGIPLHADGCAVCPECGSAWRPPAKGRIVGDTRAGQ